MNVMRIFGFFLILSLLIPSQTYTQPASQTNAQKIVSATDTSYFIPNDKDFNLILSASYGHLSNIQLMLERGADINAATSEGVTALMYAADRDDIDMVRFLLENGSKPDLKPYTGITALMSAVQQNYFEVAEILITHGAKPDIQDLNGVTALNYAAALNNYEILEMLLHYGANPDKGDSRGNTPLISASYMQSLEALEVLLKRNANPNISNKNGFTPLMAAAQVNNIDIATLLIADGARVAAINDGGMNPLAFAVKSGNVEMAEFLISKNADINHKIKAGRNLVELSKEEHQDEIYELLLSKNAKPNKFPDFRSIKLGPEVNFNSTDFMSVISFGLQDSKYKLWTDIGFGFRPLATSVFYEASPNLKYQFWEKRYFFHLGLGKKFNLLRIKGNFFTGPEIGIREIYTFGSYEGSNRKPDNLFKTVPSVGWQAMNNWMNIGLRYEYMNFNTPRVNPGRMIAYVDFKIPLTKKKLSNLKIDWLEK